MGIERPNPEEKEWKMNNPKITYTKICRDKQIEIIESKGYEINKVPREASESGLKFTEYKARQEQKKLEQAKQDYEEVLTKKIACEEEKSAIEQSIGTRQTALMGVEEDITAKMDELTTIKAQIQELTKDFDKKSAELEESLKSANMELTEKNTELTAMNKAIEEAQPKYEKVAELEKDIQLLRTNRKKIAEENTEVREKLRPIKSIATFVKHAFESFNLLMQLRQLNPYMEEIIDQNLSFNPETEYYQNESEIIEKAGKLKETLDSLDVDKEELLPVRGFSR